VPPARPSTLDRRLRGDAETIALKALEKDRDRRYQSATELADDIGRYLRDEPIAARPPSLAYQVGKFARRNRVLVGLAAAVFLLLTAAITATSWGLVQVSHARERAEREADNANAISGFLKDMLTLASPARAQGRQVTVREALDEASRTLGASLAGKPGVEAAVRSTIGYTYRSLGLYEEAEPHLRSALELRKRDLGASHPDTLVAQADLAMLLDDRGRAQEAIAMLRQTLEAQERVQGAGDLATLKTVASLAWVLREHGAFEESGPLMERAYEGLRGTLGETDPRTLKALTNFALALIDAGEAPRAEALLAPALVTGRQVLGPKHPDFLYMENIQAFAVAQQKRYAEAAALYRTVVEGANEVMGPAHPYTLYWRNSLAWTLVKDKKPEEAEGLFRSVWQDRVKALGETHHDTLDSLSGLARAELDGGDAQGAGETALRVFEQARALGVSGRAVGSQAAEVLVRVYEAAGDAASAEKYRASVIPSK
jgi:tetratricopeptide (TPR) repeat protein